MRTKVKIGFTMAAATLVLAGCGVSGPPTGAGGEGFPVAIHNCGNDVRIEHKPERVVALGPSEVTTIYAAGGASKLVARDDAGMKSVAYTPDIRQAVAAVPQLGSGGEISRENVVALQPDLVVGSVSENLTSESLSAVGIPLLALRGNCGSDHAPGSSDGTADFDDIYHDVNLFGELLGTKEHAVASVADLRRRVEAVESAADAQGRTAAGVISFNNSLEAYGRRSMIHTQFQALGLDNVFGDVDSRVFIANIEELVSRDPDVVMILSYGDTDQEAKDKFLRIPGAANLTAVRTGQIFVQPYEYSSQGILSVTGLENMARTMAKSR